MGKTKTKDNKQMKILNQQTRNSLQDVALLSNVVAIPVGLIVYFYTVLKSNQTISDLLSSFEIVAILILLYFLLVIILLQFSTFRYSILNIKINPATYRPTISDKLYIKNLPDNEKVQIFFLYDFSKPQHVNSPNNLSAHHIIYQLTDMHALYKYTLYPWAIRYIKKHPDIIEFETDGEKNKRDKHI